MDEMGVTPVSPADADSETAELDTEVGGLLLQGGIPFLQRAAELGDRSGALPLVHEGDALLHEIAGTGQGGHRCNCGIIARGRGSRRGGPLCAGGGAALGHPDACQNPCTVDEQRHSGDSHRPPDTLRRKQPRAPARVTRPAGLGHGLFLLPGRPLFRGAGSACVTVLTCQLAAAAWACRPRARCHGIPPHVGLDIRRSLECTEVRVWIGSKECQFSSRSR